LWQAPPHNFGAVSNYFPETSVRLSIFSPQTTSRATKSAIFTVLTICSVILLQAGGVFAEDIRQTFDIPRHSRGLGCAWGKLWVGGTGDRANWIWGYDPATGQLVDSLRAPVPECFGIEGMEDGLAYISLRSDSVYLITKDGVRAITKPTRYFAGLAYDGGAIWGANYYEAQGALFQFDVQGRVLSSLPFVGRQSRDMAFHLGRLYVADQLAGYIRVVNPETGRLIRVMNTPGENPSGLASDGQDLWVLDEGNQKLTSRIYRIYVRPEGGIRFSSLQHNYGSVVIDAGRSWTVWVYNDGPRDTRLINLTTRDGNADIFRVHMWNAPDFIAAGDSASLTIDFQPAYQDSVHILVALTYDLDRAENVLNLRGKGVRAQRDIQISERVLSFGLAYFGQGMRVSNMEKLVIENNGGDPLTIREFRFNDEAYTCGALEFPIVLRDPGAYTFPIFFRPTHRGYTNAGMTVISDDPDSPQINISLRGQGEGRVYPGGSVLWNVMVGSGDGAFPRVRGVQPIDDVSGDGLSDVVIASNDFIISAYHAASTSTPTPYWTYRSDANPWRSGRVTCPRALSEGSDWDNDGTNDIVVGLDGGALTVNAISGHSGKEIWMFDTHGFRGNGGNVNVAQGGSDFNNDQIGDVYAACAASGDDHTTNAVFVIDGRTKRVLWQYAMRAQPKDVRVIRDITGDGINDLIASALDGTVTALDGREGNELWSDHIAADINEMMVVETVNEDVSQDVSIVTSTHGAYMLNGSNGTELWHLSNIPNSLVATNLDDINRNGASDIVIGDVNAMLRCYDGLAATSVWDTIVYVGARPMAMAVMQDQDIDGLKDYLVGTAEGRLLCLSGNGRSGLWSYSNIGEGHGFHIVVVSRDFDGNNEDDIFAAMENGLVYAFAGSYAGNNDIGGSSEMLPATITLSAAYPNPFNSTVSLPFTLNRASEAKVGIFDLTGRQIISRSLGVLEAGQHRAIWDGQGLDGTPVGSGLYLVRFETDGFVASQKVQLVR